MSPNSAGPRGGRRRRCRAARSRRSGRRSGTPRPAGRSASRPVRRRRARTPPCSTRSGRAGPLTSGIWLIRSSSLPKSPACADQRPGARREVLEPLAPGRHRGRGTARRAAIRRRRRSHVTDAGPVAVSSAPGPPPARPRDAPLQGGAARCRRARAVDASSYRYRPPGPHGPARAGGHRPRLARRSGGRDALAVDGRAVASDGSSPRRARPPGPGSAGVEGRLAAGLGHVADPARRSFPGAGPGQPEDHQLSARLRPWPAPRGCRRPRARPRAAGRRPAAGRP